jgi:IQ calmodulin-binding motif
MEKHPPRFHRRPKDPGVANGPVASAMSTLIYDDKDVNDKTLQRKNEISPTEKQQQQQQQQWQQRDTTSTAQQQRNNNGSDASAIPTVALGEKELSINKQPLTLEQRVQQHNRECLLPSRNSMQSSNSNWAQDDEYYEDDFGDYDDYDDNKYDNKDDYDNNDDNDYPYDNHKQSLQSMPLPTSPLPTAPLLTAPLSTASPTAPPPTVSPQTASPPTAPPPTAFPPTTPPPTSPLPTTPLPTKYLPTVPKQTEPLPTVPTLTRLHRPCLHRSRTSPSAKLPPLMEYEEHIYSAIAIQSLCRGAMARAGLLFAHACVTEIQRHVRGCFSVKRCMEIHYDFPQFGLTGILFADLEYEEQMYSAVVIQSLCRGVIVRARLLRTHAKATAASSVTTTSMTTEIHPTR